MQRIETGRAPLDVYGSLEIRGNGAFKIDAEGRKILVRPDGWRTCLELFRAGPSAAWKRKTVRALSHGLQRSDLSLELRVGGRRIARLGSDARSGVDLGWRALLLGALATVLPARRSR